MSRASRRAHLQPEGAKPRQAKPKEPPAAPASADGAVPEVSDLDMAFPTRYRELLPKWESLTKDEQSMRGPFCDAISMLFYKGGKLTDHGIAIKPGVDSAKVHRYLRATMGDFGPKHEHKIGGIGHMLAKWCTHTPKGKP